MSDVTTPASAEESAARSEEMIAQELVERARSEGAALVGAGGLLTGLTKTVLETALEAELDEHLGYPKHAVEGNNTGNSRNGSRAKTVLTDIGPVEIEVPRDREGSFDPKIVRKRQRRLPGVDELVVSLASKGLTTGEISAHLADVYGAEVSKETISRITEAVVEEMTAWQSRPLDRVYPVVFIDTGPRQAPGGQGRQPARVHGRRRQRPRRARHPRALGRRRRRGAEVLASGPLRDSESRHG